jgi:hypothetical protein
VQEPITGKPAEVDPTVQQLLTAKPKLSGAANRKLKKASVGQSGTGGPVRPGHETSPRFSMVPKTHRSGGHTPTKQSPKKSRAALERRF